MGRWLGIDHGSRRIGLAVGSTDEKIATPLKTLPAEPAEKLPAAIADQARAYDAQGLVVGLPLNMDGTEGPQAALARAMAVTLARETGMDVRLWDERLSSFQADAQLAGQLTRKKRRARQDGLAAASFLEDFLACDGPACAPTP